MNIYEPLGIGYLVASTAVFTAEMIFFVAKGVGHTYRLIQRAQAEENLDVERSLSIKRELANVNKVNKIHSYGVKRSGVGERLLRYWK